ncbi:MAG: enoyl-CoA hydratase/isomerase family protein [Parvibaculum sp.]|uniref:enoyl-CoA hydratase/isomerase family protein n=1 Tax=Parvibaculum sp. TaxID=2024848 RepID=UPI002725C1B5|nr:enoyl-CoA hydratase/isomerase family protein [Parvibaculum sp.]MDO8838321.1 enoyl-CoA hydratase/isomerase family protein [Parvibaculum sp.]
MVQSEKVGEFITIERAGRVATVRFDRGDRVNALSARLLRDLTATARLLRDDVTTSAVILTGGKAFTGGADLADPEMVKRASASLLERREMLRAGPDMCDAWEALDQVTIVAIEGFCIGGGVALSVACDFRIAGRGAHFRLPEIPLGMNMSWHTQPRMVNLIGPSRAKQLTIFGERVGAEQAEQWGLIDEICDDGKALESAHRWAEKVAALPPVSVRMAKRGITQAATALNAAVTFMDADQFALAATGEDSREAIAAFLEKRSPNFTGR